MTFDFQSWLKVQPDDGEYKYIDCTGKCAVGQWMTSQGEDWNIDLYHKHINREFNTTKKFQALSNSSTFGELRRKLELV